MPRNPYKHKPKPRRDYYKEAITQGSRKNWSYARTNARLKAFKMWDKNQTEWTRRGIDSPPFERPSPIPYQPRPSRGNMEQRMEEAQRRNYALDPLWG